MESVGSTAMVTWPRLRGALTSGASTDPNRTPVSIYSFSNWTSHWLPSGFSAATQRQQVSDSLERARALSQLVRKPLPAGIELSMFAGDKFPTKSQVYVDSNGGIDYKSHGGDGTVLLVSATQNRESSSRVSFAKHGKIFEDDHVAPGLQRILVPTGALQETAMDNNWHDEYMNLSTRFDALIGGC